jgi:hypothetical protein
MEEEKFIVNGAGLIPGVPGQFSNCIVTKNKDGSITVTPLPQHSEYLKPEEEEPPAQQEAPLPPLIEESPTIPLTKPTVKGGN